MKLLSLNDVEVAMSSDTTPLGGHHFQYFYVDEQIKLSMLMPRPHQPLNMFKCCLA